jgi:hypothetical protein
MTLLPLTDCCLLLGIDPKTLRLWLKSAHLSCTVHPTDARLKCLTQPQLHHLASLHGRCLPESLPLPAGAAAPLPTSAPLAAEAEPPIARACSPAADADLRHTLVHLQTQVATLQEQVTQLALSVLRERDWRWEERLSQAQAPLPTQAMHPPLTRPAGLDTSQSRLNDPAPTPAALDPAPSRTRSRSRALPLIDYGADGRYLAICPTQGVLPLLPDSPEWFDWLASLTAFTFQGVNGRFSTTCKVRKGQRAHAWSAYRSLHGRSCNLYLGLTSHLTLAHLEQMAAKMQAHLTPSKRLRFWSGWLASLSGKVQL